MKVYGYVRVSSVQQDLNRQKKLIRDYCNYKGYSLIRIEEDKISGATSSRKGLDKILSLSKDNADMVVVSELSRLSREDDAHKIITKVYDILDNGLKLVLLDQPDKVYEGSIPFVDYLTLAVKAFGAADERKKIASRMKTGKYDKISQFPNMVTDSNIPFGFKSVRNPNYIVHVTPKAFLEIDEVNAKYVRMIYQYILDGKTAKEVGRIMYDMDIKGMRKGNFLSSIVVRILRNPLYKGERIFKGRTYRIKPIVEESVWNQAQIMLDNNRRFKGNTVKHIFPLKNIFKCPCGKNMTVLRNSYNNQLYTCSSIYSLDKCKNSGIKMECLDTIVWESVKEVVLSQEYEEKTEKEIDKIIKLNMSLEDSIIDIEKDITYLEKKMDKLVSKIAVEDDDTLSNALRNQYLSLKEEMQNKEDGINNVNAMITENNLKIESLSNYQDNLVEYDDTEKKELYQKVLDFVVYYSETSRKGFVVINYKNGIQSVGIYYVPKKAEIYLLQPYTIFNKETRKVIIRDKEYTVNEILKNERAELTALSPKSNPT